MIEHYEQITFTSALSTPSSLTNILIRNEEQVSAAIKQTHPSIINTTYPLRVVGQTPGNIKQEVGSPLSTLPQVSLTVSETKLQPASPQAKQTAH